MHKSAAAINLKKAVLQVARRLQPTPCLFQCIAAFAIPGKLPLGKAPVRHTGKRCDNQI